jgi:hypothetical protein
VRKWFFVAALLPLAACGTSSASAGLPTTPELAAFPLADVQEIIKRDDSGYSSTKQRVASVQKVAMGWSACRDVYGVYLGWTKTGKVAARPLPKLPAKETDGAKAATEAWIETLYAPMSQGDRSTAVAQLSSNDGCGKIPLDTAARPDFTIADAIKAI